MPRQVIALGGGGFSMEPENPLLDLYVLRAASNPSPKICFVPTASGDSEGYVQRFYSAFEGQPCLPTHLSLFRLPSADLRGFVLEQDVIYVGGGNTKSLMGLWREWGLDDILREAYAAGVVMAGISAGCICWFEEGVTDSIPGALTSLQCLGLLEGSACPHYDGEEERRPTYTRFVAGGDIKPGYAMDDGAAVHFIDEQFLEAVCSVPAAKAYEVTRVEGKAVERPLPTRYLKTGL